MTLQEDAAPEENCDVDDEQAWPRNTVWHPGSGDAATRSLVYAGRCAPDASLWSTSPLPWISPTEIEPAPAPRDESVDTYARDGDAETQEVALTPDLLMDLFPVEEEPVLGSVVRTAAIGNEMPIDRGRSCCLYVRDESIDPIEVTTPRIPDECEDEGSGKFTIGDRPNQRNCKNFGHVAYRHFAL